MNQNTFNINFFLTILLYMYLITHNCAFTRCE